jgi:DNA-directed RNA polymerase subunit beta'
MTTTTTVGQMLLNDALPPTHQIHGQTSKKDLMVLMSDLAKTDPATYVKTVSKLKAVGDRVITGSGITVGLDDIEPEYKGRDAILKPALARMRETKDHQKRVDIIVETQKKMLEHTRSHPGQMTVMAVSGARGKLPQLMRTVASPIAVVDENKNTIPWMIGRSFSEGLTGPDAWAEMTEARRNVVEGQISVTEPGAMSKMFVNTMSDQIITMPDCGTTNGILMDASDSQIMDRYIAGTNELVTPRVAMRLRKEGGQVKVRSPLTCEASDGVCQRCQGLNEKGQVHTVGTNVGIRAAQSLSEPLTQMVLGAKHALGVAETKGKTLEGLHGVKQLVEVPESFFNKATLAAKPGHVTKIETAPQGGNYVYVNSSQYYVPPNLSVLVKKGDQVDAGDVLSDGIPKPDELVAYKGLGVGRKYLTDALYGVYSRNGIDIDKRHLETLAKTDLNYVRIMDNDSPELGVMRGDIVNYNKFRQSIADHSMTVPTSEALGQYLGNNLLHHTAGTEITSAVLQDFKKQGIKNIPVAPRVPQHEMIMKPIARTPLLRPDWLARMGHRHLKQSLLEGAAFGEASDIHGTHPIPAFTFGAEFGQGSRGHY